MNMNVKSKRDAGSSTESILPTNNRQVERTNAAMEGSQAPSIVTSDTAGEGGIQVRQDFLVGYDERSYQDVLAFERSRRPVT